MIDKSSRTVEVSQSDTKNNIKGEREYSPVTSMSFHQSEVVYHQLLLPHKLHGYFHPADAITVQSELTVTSTLKAIEVLEYIEPICIKAHLEAHVLDLYIPTHLGLEE